MRINKTAPGLLAAALLSTINPQRSTCFGQGALAPPGAPAPMMKSLDQIEPRALIASLPYTITNSGSYYLAASLTGAANQNGIIIQADNVTLDLNGFALIGVAASSNGVYVVGSPKNLLIRNGTVLNWGSDGISGYHITLFTASGAVNSQIENVRASNNGGMGVGIYQGGTIKGCVAQSNGGNGIALGGFGTVSGCSSSSNGGSGINAGPGSTVGGCAAFHNSGVGISASAGTVKDCTANANTGDGIDDTDGVVSGCTIVGNGGLGVNMGNNGLIKDCHAENNTVGGFSASAQSIVTGCNARGNYGFGINAGTGSTIQNCTAIQNTSDGILVSGSSLVLDNNCSINGNGVTTNAAIHATGSQNRIEGNHVVGQAGRGVKVDAAGNLVTRNTAHGNGVNFDIASGNTSGAIVTSEAAMNASTNSLVNISF